MENRVSLAPASSRTRDRTSARADLIAVSAFGPAVARESVNRETAGSASRIM